MRDQWHTLDFRRLPDGQFGVFEEFRANRSRVLGYELSPHWKFDFHAVIRQVWGWDFLVRLFSSWFLNVGAKHGPTRVVSFHLGRQHGWRACGYWSS
jgi:hypothetical protein